MLHAQVMYKYDTIESYEASRFDDRGSMFAMFNILETQLQVIIYALLTSILNTLSTAACSGKFG